MRKHLTKCFLAGLLALLPIGGLILIVLLLDRELRPLVRGTILDFPGMALVLAVLGVYLTGLVVSTFAGRWLLGLADRLFRRVPGLGSVYGTLKQILGYGSGPEALFRSVVLIRDEATGTAELGFVTQEVRADGENPRWAVFLPGAPNPASGRLVLVEPERCIPTRLSVDAAFKALFTTGKSGW